MTIGEKIKYLRNQLNMTQDELAIAAGTKKQTIHKYETGIISNIPASKIKAMADKLQTTPAFLMGWDNYSTPLPTENTVHITRRTGAQSNYILSDENVELVEGIAKRLSSSDEQIPGTIAAVTGEINKSGKKKKPKIL